MINLTKMRDMVFKPKNMEKKTGQVRHYIRLLALCALAKPQQICLWAVEHPSSPPQVLDSVI